MKIQITTTLALVFILTACNIKTKSDAENGESKYSENYSGPIIDMHIHAYSQVNPLFGVTHPPTLRNDTFTGVNSVEEHMEKTIEKFRKHNIVKALVTDGQIWFDKYPDLVLIGAANKNIDNLRLEYNSGKLQAIAEMAPFYDGILADDPSQIPFFQLAEELGIPAGFHIFPGGPNNGIHIMPEMLGGMRTYNANPMQLEKVLVKYPNLKLYVMHGGWPFIEDIKALMYAHPNVYLDTAVTNWILPQEEFDNYLKALFDAGFGKRIMYGTDQMVWPDVIDVGVETVNKVDFLTLSQKEDIFFDNAAEFLGLSENEIAKLKSR